MSTTIDEKVVQMKFDNSQFEGNVKTSLSTINELKQSLNFSGIKNGFESITEAAGNVNISGIGNAVETVTSKFSALEVMAIATLANITNSVVDAGKKIVNSLTIEPVMSGFQEYETQINAVQTILANTQNGVTKVNTKAIETIKETAEATTEATKKANEEELSDFKETQSDKLDEFKKNQSKELDAYEDYADEELSVIKNKYEQESSDLEKALDDELTALSEAHNEKLGMYEEEYEEKLKIVDEERYNKIKAIDDEIESIQNLTKEEEAAIKKNEQAQKLASLQSAVNAATSSEERKKAEEALTTYQEKLAREQLLEERNNKIAALKESKDAINEEYKATEEQITKEYEEKADKENELYSEKYNNISEESAKKQSELKANYEEEKALLQEQIDFEKEALEEKQAQELKAFTKQQSVELEGLKEKQKIALENIEERKNAEISAINASAKASKGSTLEDVNKALDELNTYADKTIYNFTEMTRNIGTFTAAGVDLDTSVAAIKGIANLAAVSGSTSQQASTAMYQLSQALASGTVKLQDWNSVVNAGMGGQVFQDALKETARVHGVAIDQMISEEGSFRETLSNGWLTSDILTETLSKFTGDLTKEQIKAMGYTDEQIESIIKMGETANDAATKVKTFTQLFDTLAEAAQSGWTQSWETIIGDFEEAKELLTSVSDVVSNMIQASADARNAILSDWKALGGRTKLIDAVRNSFNAVLSIITPVKEAFSDIFPPVTGQQLADLSAKIADITSKFIISDETADKLYRTFSGCFAMFDIGKQALTALADGLSPLLTLLPGCGDGILDVTAKMGDWLVKLDENIKKNETFKKAVEEAVTFIQGIPSKINSVFQSITGMTIGEAFEKIAEKASDALDKIKDVITGFGKVDTSGITTLSDNVETGFKPLEILFGGILTIFEGLWKFFEMIAPIFGKLATILGSALGSIGNALMDAIGNADFDKILDIVNGGVLIAIGTAIKKFMDSITGVADNASGILEQIKGIFDGVQGCLESWQNNLKAKTLLTIASAIGILTASVLVLSGIDSGKLTASLAAMTAEFIDLFAAIAIFEKVTDSDGFDGVKKVTTAMIPLAASILILSFAMKNIAELDWEGVIKGLISVTTLCTVLTNSAKQLSDNNEQMMKGATGLIAFALAIKILAGPVKELGMLSVESLGKGLLGVLTLCSMLAVFLKEANLDDISLGKGLGLITLAEAINILATAVGKFAEMDLYGMLQGLGAVTTLLSMMAVFIKETEKAQNVTSTAIGLTILSGAVLIMSKAVESMGNLSLEQIAKGLGTMIVALSTMIFVVNSIKYDDTLLVSTGILLISAALKIMVSAIKDIGDMSWEEIEKGLLSVITVLSMMAVVINSMPTESLLTNAAAILVISAALAVLAPVLKSLGDMTLTEIGTSLLTLAGAFTVIGVAGLLLTPIVPGILSLAGAIALLGVGTVACGAGILALSTGLSSLAITGTAGIATLVLAIEGILSLIPQIVIKVGEGIVALIVAIGNAAPELALTVYKIVTALALVLTEAAPMLIESVLTALDELLASLSNHLPSIIQSGMDIALAFLKGIRDNIGEMTSVFIDIILETIEAMAEKADEIIQAGIDLVVALIDGLAKGIEDNTERIKQAFINLFKALLKSVKEFLGIHSPSTEFKDIGINIIQGLIDGVTGLIEDVKTKAKEVMSKMVDVVTEKVSEFKTKGQEIIQNLKDGIGSKISEIKSKATEVIDSALSTIKDKISEFKQMGSDVIDGFKNGIQNGVKKVSDSAKDVADNVVTSVKNVLGIHSPSKVFKKIGKYTDEGLINGLEAYSGKVSDTLKNVVKTAIKNATGMIDMEGLINSNGVLSIGEKIAERIEETTSHTATSLSSIDKSIFKNVSNLASLINDGIDSEPVITPVVDLTNVEDSASQINGLMSSTEMVDVVGKNSFRLSNAVASDTDGTISFNSDDIVSAIEKLRTDVGEINTKIGNAKIVMDTGSLVGSILTPISVELGKRIVLRKRGL